MEEFTTAAKKKLIWSPAPRKEYSVLYQGKMNGIGLNPIFDMVTGAWNILWLTSPGIDGLLDWEGTASAFPYTATTLPPSVAAALQLFDYSASPNEVIGLLAEELTPHQFLDKMDGHKTFIPVQIYGKDWLELALKKADEYATRSTNVIKVNFSRRS